MRLFSWILRLMVVLILGQTLFFKFSAHPESVALFRQLGVEPWGRWAVGVLELGAVTALLLPATAPWGALLSWLLMSGALFAHVTVLGFAGPMASLALLALAAWAASALLLWPYRRRFARRCALRGAG